MCHNAEASAVPARVLRARSTDHVIGLYLDTFCTHSGMSDAGIMVLDRNVAGSTTICEMPMRATWLRAVSATAVDSEQKMAPSSSATSSASAMPPMPPG